MKPPDTIKNEAHFYGYIVGLHLEPSADKLDSETPTKMFATFEYGGTQTIWEVPDFGLFTELSHHLMSNAEMRYEHQDYGYAKLWIEKKANGWEVDLP